MATSTEKFRLGKRVSIGGKTGIIRFLGTTEVSNWMYGGDCYEMNNDCLVALMFVMSVRSWRVGRSGIGQARREK